MRKVGIYTITNIITNKIYVGESLNINYRLTNHKLLLKTNKHKNSYLQNSYNKYGKDNFKFEILEECDEYYLKSNENFWCNMLNTHNKNYGYNIRSTSDSLKSKLSQETKIKISSSYKLKYKSGYRNPKKGKKLSEETKLKIGKSNSIKKWSSDHRIKMLNIFNNSVNRKLALEKININKKGRGTKGGVIQLNSNNEILNIFKSTIEAGIVLKCNPSTIAKCCRGVINTCKGFKFKYNNG